MDTYKYVLLTVLIIMISCIPETRNLTPSGDTAEIKTRSNKLYSGELLMVDEEAIIMRIKSSQNDRSEGIYKFPKESILSIEIEDYINYKWQGAILGFEVLPIALLFIAASSANAEAGGLAILLIPVFLNFVIFGASTPAPPGVEDPFQSEQLLELRKYARFPQGLDDDQLKPFLSIYNQDKIKIIQ